MENKISDDDKKDIEYLHQRLIESFGKNIPKHLLEPKNLNETDKESEERYSEIIWKMIKPEFEKL